MEKLDQQTEQQKNGIHTVITEIIARCINGEIAASTITPATSLIDDLDLDSASMVDVVLDIEDHFKIKITALESQSAFTVGDLEALVLRKQKMSAESA